MSNTSTFLPMGNITGIGSLPLRDPDEAVAFVESCALRIPFWPQLPQRAPSEGMIEQALLPFSDLLRRASRAPIYDVMPGASIELARRLDDSPAELDTTRAAGFFAFEKALSAGAFAEALALKGQIVGPVTLAAQLRIGGRPLLEARGSDIPLAIELFRALGWYATRLALWQVERLRRWSENVILMLDEPCLSLAACCASPVAQHALPILKEALAMIRVGGAVAGVHCCARLPTALVCQAHPDLISFDAHQGLEEFVADPHMQTFMQAGGLVAFGLIPTALDLSAFQPLTLLSRWLESALTVGNIADLAKRSLFTATCGLGLVSEQAMRQSFQLARQLSASVTTLLQRAARNPSAPDSSTPAPRLRRPHPYTAFHLWKKKTD